MSIFKKAEESAKLPSFVNNAFFDDSKIEVKDEFDSLLKEANSNKFVYENRVNGFKKSASEMPEFNVPTPALYSDSVDGIKRSSYGRHFYDEPSLNTPDKVRSLQYDGTRKAESHMQNGFSIWEPEFDDIQNAFMASQEQTNQIFDRRTMMEKKLANKNKWEADQLNSIRKSNVLPYRGLGVARLANDVQVDHNKINNLGDFYAEANDAIREMTRAANRDRKAKLSRNGYDPEDNINSANKKEFIEARTMAALSNNSEFLLKFAEEISLDDL